MKNKSIQHWVVVALLCGLAAASIGICQNTPGVFYTAVSDDIGVMRGTFAFHATFSLLAIAVNSLAVPKLMKTLNLRLLILIGGIIMTLSTVGMSMAQSLYTFYVLGVTRGIGASLCANVPITILINRWFEKNNGTATSIALSFSGIAGAVCSPWLSSCIAGRGWRSAYLLQAVMIAVFVLPALLIRLPESPEKVGLLPYGAQQNEVDHPNTEKGRSSKKIVSLPFVLFAMFAIMHTSITGVSQHLSGMGINMGLSMEEAGFLLSLAMLGNIGTKLLIGVLSDRIGPLKASMCMIIVNLFAMILLFIGFTNEMSLMIQIGALLFGSVYSVGAVGIALLTKNFFGAENFPSVYPKLSFMISLGSSMSLPLIGYVYDFTGSYNTALLIGAGFDIINLVLIAVIAKTVGNRQKA